MEYETFHIKVDDKAYEVYLRLAEKRVEDGLHLRVINEKSNSVCYYRGCLMADTGYYEHRVDGPSWILYGGDIMFCVRGQDHINTVEYCRAAGMSDEETLMWVLQFGEKLPTTIDGFYGLGDHGWL